MGKLQELLIETAISEAVATGGKEPTQEELDEILRELLPGFLEYATATLLGEINKSAKRNLNRNRKRVQGFERRLAKHWRKPLDRLELTIEIAQETGEGVADEVASGEVSIEEHTFKALRGIHARACQMSRAILTLLRSGFADDAHARWRSLHELAVVANFIEQHGDEVAERYLLHEVVQQRKLARLYKEYEVRANLEPITQAEIDALDDQCKKLVNRFGKSFTEEYGWAACALKNRQPSLAEIERATDLDHFRPYYRMASDNVHPNSHGTFYKLGGFSPDLNILLAGPSNLGLADPGHGTALSLTQITAALVNTTSSLDTLTELTVLRQLEDEVGTAFLEAHESAEAITEKKDPSKQRAPSPRKSAQAET